MALIDIATALSSTVLRARCEGAILKNAPSIARESRTVFAHDKRRQLALLCLRSGIAWGEWQRWVVSDGTVLAAAADVSALSDAQIESLVLTIWNSVAGVDPADAA